MSPHVFLRVNDFIDQRSNAIFDDKSERAISCRNITLNVEGTLTLDEKGNYSFKGKLGAEPDAYRFYSSTHRDPDAEVATRVGKLLPGREFTVRIIGQKPIEGGGKYP